MKTQLEVEGMHCNSCKMLIEDIASEIEGIISCKVDVKTGKVSVEYTGKESLDELKHEIRSAGDYTVS